MSIYLGVPLLCYLCLCSFCAGLEAYKLPNESLLRQNKGFPLWLRRHDIQMRNSFQSFDKMLMLRLILFPWNHGPKQRDECLCFSTSVSHGLWPNSASNGSSPSPATVGSSAWPPVSAKGNFPRARGHQ